MQMKQAGAKVKVAKNSLAKIALDGTDVAVVAPLLKGPTVIAYSGDPVAARRFASDFAKTNQKFVILGGAMGKTALNPDGVRRSPRCRRLTNCRASSSASCRRRRPRLRSLSMPRPAKGCEGDSGLCRQGRSRLTGLPNLVEVRPEG